MCAVLEMVTGIEFVALIECADLKPATDRDALNAGMALQAKVSSADHTSQSAAIPANRCSMVASNTRRTADRAWLDPRRLVGI